MERLEQKAFFAASGNPQTISKAALICIWNEIHTKMHISFTKNYSSVFYRQSTALLY